MPLSCERCKFPDAFKNMWNIHLDFESMQFICSDCYVERPGLPQGELTGRERGEIVARLITEEVKIDPVCKKPLFDKRQNMLSYTGAESDSATNFEVKEARPMGNRRTRAVITAGLLISSVALFSGCMKSLKSEESAQSALVAKSEERVTSPSLPQEPPAKGAPSAVQPVTTPAESPLQDIFFDFDRSNLRGDAQSILKEDLLWLRTNQSAQITIEGHCDERGTAEYNLALGERRAKATKDFLAAAGIDDKRTKVVSFGKERPFVQGHDESAWKWNRRAHFVVSER